MGLRGRLVGEVRIRLLRFWYPYRDDERCRQWSRPAEFQDFDADGQTRREFPRLGLAVDRCTSVQTIGSFFGGADRRTQRNDESRMMKIVGSHSALRTAILAMGFSAGLPLAGH